MLKQEVEAPKRFTRKFAAFLILYTAFFTGIVVERTILMQKRALVDQVRSNFTVSGEGIRNIGIRSDASGGAENYSFYSEPGDLLNVGSTTLGDSSEDTHVFNGDVVIRGTLTLVHE